MAKVELFDKELQEAGSMFKSLSHPARLAILKYLAEAKVCISGEISDELPLSRTTVHQHLEELKKAGLIVGEIEGVKKNYCLNPERIQHLRDTLNSFLIQINCCHTNNC